MTATRQNFKTAPIDLVWRRLLSGGAWAFGGKILIAFLGLVSNALLARLLTPQDLGAYFLAYSIVGFATALGSLGLGEGSVRLVAEAIGLNLFGRVRRVIGAVLSIGALGALGLGITYLLIGGTLGESVFNAPALAAVSGLVAGWIMVEIVQGFWSEIFRGFHDIRLSTFLGGQTTGSISGLVTVALITASLFLLWLVKGDTTLATILFLAICSGALSSLLACWLLHRKMVRLPQPSDEGRETGFKEVLGEVFSIAWPLTVANVVLFLARYGDVWVLGAFRPEEDVAIYGAAVRLVSVVTMTLVVIYAIVPPLIAEMYAQGRREELERIIRAWATLTGIPGFLASAACIIFAGPILGLVYGDYYREGATAMALLGAAFLATVWAGSGGWALMMTGHQKAYMSITFGFGIATFLAMIAAGGVYGITGVAITRLISAWLSNGLIVLVTKQKTGMWVHAGFIRMSDLLRYVR